MKYASDGLLAIVSNRKQDGFPMGTIGYIYLDIIKTLKKLDYDEDSADLVSRGILLGSLMHRKSITFNQMVLTKEHNQAIKDYLDWYKKTLSDSARLYK